MIFFEYLRNRAFWLRDRAKGGLVHKYVQELEAIESRQELSEEQLDERYSRELDRLLRHCVDTVPAYAGLSYILDAPDKISAWPVVNKSDLKSGGVNTYPTSIYKTN